MRTDEDLTAANSLHLVDEWGKPSHDSGVQGKLRLFEEEQ